MKFLLFGTGDYYERYKKWFHKEEVVALLDNSPKKQNTEIDGIRVMSPEDGVCLEFDAVVILSFYVKEMRAQLLQLGVNSSCIFHFFDMHKIVPNERKCREIGCYGAIGESARKEKKAGKSIALLSHDLTYGGPALALYHVAEVLISNGWQVTFASMLDGPTREFLLEQGIPVIVDENLQVRTMKQTEWVADFDMVLCNTIGYYVFLTRRQENIPVVWWLHDSAFFYEGVDKKLLNEIDSNNLKVLSVGPVPKNAMQQFRPDLRIEDLLYGVKDAVGGYQEKPVTETVNFVTVGYIEWRKGQDILQEAIKLLPRHVLEQCAFSIVGQDTSMLAQELKQECTGIPQVHITGVLNRGELNALLETMDMMLCPSREDPMPTVAAEAMMHSVPCLISDATGTAAYINNGRNGLLFQSENAKELAEKIQWCVEHKSEVHQMRAAARETYEKVFSVEALQASVKKNIENKRRIAIYGLSTETERVLREWNGAYEVMGLLDSFRTEGEQFGYPILSIENVVKEEGVVIVVVARPGSCKAIAKKIGTICREHDVLVYDIRGNNLLEEKKAAYDLKSVLGYTHAEFAEQMKAAEVVSFDLFDTLIVRNVLSQADVPELVNIKLQERGIAIADFCKKRQYAEKKLSQNYAPKLCEIYKTVLEESENVRITAEELAALEFETDLSLAEARTDMVEALQAAKHAGKQICITTDTYYNRNQLQKIFEKCGIDKYDALFASCEYGIGKTGGLFEAVKTMFETARILHVGDDATADVESAKRHGLKAFKIFSSSEFLDAVGGFGLPAQEECLSDRIKMGIFAASIFNHAFLFETENGRIPVKSARQIGLLFCAPMILDFVFWFEETRKNHGLDNVWFGARDGYLLQKVYEQVFPSVKTEYFLTSRTAAIRAGVETEVDVAYIDSMKFAGTEEENLRKRFGLRAEEFDLEKEDVSKEGLLKYTYGILNRAKENRQNYLCYVNRLKPVESGVAFFDFVAKGTTQLFLEKILRKKITGLYFLQLEQEFMRDKGLDIHSFYEPEDKSSSIFDNYYILETILTSPEPSLDGFSAVGEALFAQETRKREDITCVMEIQQGILEYVQKYLKLCPMSEWNINQKLDEAFLSLIHNVEMGVQEFLQLTVEDPFFNRQTELRDLL